MPEDAPDAERIRRALPVLQRRRTRRQRIALAVVAVLPIAAPALLWHPGASSNHPGVRPEPSPSLIAPVPLGYRPTWLPAGMHERFRGVAGTGNGELRIQRAWTADKVGTGGGLPRAAITLTVQQMPNPADPAASAAQTTEINGTTAAYTGTRVSWLADATHIVEVSMSGTDLLRVARSVQDDPTIFGSPLRLDWTPPGRSDVTYELSGDSGIRWNATVVFTDPGVTVTLAPSTDAPWNEVEIVNVAGTLSKDELIDVLSQVAATDPFDADWLD